MQTPHGNRVSSKIPLEASGLREVQIEVTAKCNADCSFCINRSSWAADGRHTNGLPTATLRRVIDWIADAGVRRIRFSGGEPLLRKDLPVLLAHAKARGITTVVNTNGFLVDRYIDEMYELADVVLISVISTRAEITDEVMVAKGSHAKKLVALDLLEDHPNVWTSTVISRGSIEEFEALYQFMKAHHVNYWLLLRGESNGSLDQHHYDVQHGELVEIIEKIRRLEGEHGELIGIGNAVPVCTYDAPFLTRVLGRADGAFASEGRSKLSITPYGKVLPSYGIDHPIGDIFDDLEDLWKHAFAAWIRSTDAMPAACRACDYLSVCHGGSRIAAMDAYGAWDAPDPLMRPLPQVPQRRLKVVGSSR
jgi:pyrroloquinoline quinone biosynthesis protein E